MAVVKKKKVVKKETAIKNKVAIKNVAAVRKKPVKSVMEEKVVRKTVRPDEEKVENVEIEKNGGSVVWKILTVLLFLVAVGVIGQSKFGWFDGVLAGVKGNSTVNQVVVDEKLAPEVKVVDEKDKFKFVMKIVYKTDDERQKSLISEYIKNIENNLGDIVVEYTEIDSGSTEGKDLIAKTGSKFTPLFIADDSLKNYSGYAGLMPFVTDKGGLIDINSSTIDFVQFPEVGQARVLGGNFKNAKTKILVYTSMTCPFCANMHATFKKLVEEDKTISVAYKNFDRGGNDLILSEFAECSADLGKYEVAVDYLF